jgi:hypothetical protein
MWGLLALPVLLGLVALYTIRSQPQHRKLPSLRIWQEVLKRKRPNSLLSRYRNSLFFFLQMAALVLGFLAIMQPFRVSDTSGDVLLVADLSASMGAEDGRLSQAQEKLTELVDALTLGARARLLTVGPIPKVLTEFTQERSLLRGAIGKLQAQPGPAMAPDQLLARLASSRSPKTHQVHLVTDQYRPEDFPGGLPGTRLHIHYVGSSEENVAITRLDVRPQGSLYQVAALVRNFSQIPAEVVVELQAAGPQVTRRETIPPGGRERLLLFKGASPKKGVLGVTLRVARGPEDRLTCDNQAWSAPRRGAVRVLLVSSDPEDLQKALKLEPSVAVALTSPEKLPSPEELQGFDLVVADRFWSPSLEALPLLLFHPRKTTPFSSGRKLASLEMTGMDSTHPVNRYLNLREVHFGSGVLLDRVEGGNPVVYATSGPLVVARNQGKARQVVCAFDLKTSDLPKRIGFPIFLTNVVRWLLANDSKLKGHFRVGQAIRLGKVAAVQLTTPAGETKQLKTQGGVLTPFESTGIFHIQRSKGRALPYPVNLLDPGESRIAPVAQGSTVAGENQLDKSVGSSEQELWKLLLLAGLGILSLEWLLLSLRGGAA